MSKRSRMIVIAVVGMLSIAGPAFSFIITPGELSTNEFGARYRNLAENAVDNIADGGEIYLGVDGLGVGANRVEIDYGYTGEWLLDPSVNHVKFQYDKANNKILTQVTSLLNYNLEYTNVSAHIPNPGNIDLLNCMMITLKSRNTSLAPLDFRNATVNGTSLGTTFHANSGDWLSWSVTGFDFSNSFTVEGDLVLLGTPQGSQEYSNMEIKFGYAVPEPATLSLLALGGLLLKRRK